PAAAAPSQAAPRKLAVGASESASLVPDAVLAKTRMDLAVLAGFTEIEVRAGWAPGKTEPTAEELASFQASALAAQLDAVRLVIAVDTGGSLQTPSSLLDRKQFAEYAAALARSLPYVRDFIVGNEPNLNMFWMPQFAVRGRDVAARAYEALLARTYDSLKAVSPALNVIGGALAPSPRARSRTASTASRPESPRTSPASTRTSASRARPTPSRRRCRLPTTSGRSSSRTASRRSPGCSSSTSATSPISTAGSRGSSTPMTRRSRTSPWSRAPPRPLRPGR